MAATAFATTTFETDKECSTSANERDIRRLCLLLIVVFIISPIRPCSYGTQLCGYAYRNWHSPLTCFRETSEFKTWILRQSHFWLNTTQRRQKSNPKLISSTTSKPGSNIFWLNTPSEKTFRTPDSGLVTWKHHWHYQWLTLSQGMSLPVLS
jgi:hypothetical protein